MCIEDIRLAREQSNVQFSFSAVVNGWTQVLGYGANRVAIQLTVRGQACDYMFSPETPTSTPQPLAATVIRISDHLNIVHDGGYIREPLWVFGVGTNITVHGTFSELQKQ